MSISTHYGGSVLAVKSRNSIAFLTDLRLGQGNFTTSMNFPKIHKITSKLFVGLPQFIPDAQFLLKKIIKNHNLFVLNENRPMEPEELTNMVSYILYSRRFTPLFTSPVIAGFNKFGEPYVSGMDQIGCLDEPEDFVVSGTAERNLAGMCEALWQKDLEGEDLFVMAVQAFANAIDRDALSGWGIEGFLIQNEKVLQRRVRMRLD
ncbi:hypothetical protein EDEG_03183 [Edhazardia aedis USNM 41457]|uniref:Proteasome subunit beta type-3 n=1 Tax=Edhazardia aedis (strain USNM 41457) TaxID=1003232 RepID=J9D4A9_EDHAE|nr:hypothetical protein EDEG_03183 [Edhazardia aedis USNM 41457]|eukprot:EJW02389.1 hypothetical protein EDEG_03183 [Edhazardia aedis USNM 41457]